MKLIVDIGNTFSKLAVFDGDSIAEFRTINGLNIDDIRNLLVDFKGISSSIISSVTIHDTKINKLLVEKGRSIELDAGTPVPFINKYGTPNTLGKDRIAIAAAATTLCPKQNTLIIDAGTSVTYDFVNAKGEYLGGGISPGLKMRFDALHNFTGKLPLIELPNYNEKIELVGNSTEASILSGVVNGLTSEIENIVYQYNTLYPELKTIISGGDYKYFERLVKSNIFATPNIVVTGLKSILDFNEKN